MPHYRLETKEKGRLDRFVDYLKRTPLMREEGFARDLTITLFRLSAMETTLPAQMIESGTYDGFFASILGIINPSDGHPQEEHAPDFGWFRPLAHNNPTWVLYWPELEV